MYKILIFFLLIVFIKDSQAQDHDQYLSSYYSTYILNKKPQIIYSDDPNKLYTPFYVDYDYEKDQCIIKYNRLKDSFKEDLIQFTIYHELSHCVLYQEATFFNHFPDIYYLLIADSLNYQQDRVIGYDYFHELFADGLASAIYLKNNNDIAYIKSIIQWRDSGLGGTHTSSRLLEKIILIDWSQITTENIKEKVLAITEEYFINDWMSQHFNDFIGTSLKSYTNDLIQTFWDSYNNQTSKDERDFYKERLLGLGDTIKNPKYIFIQSLYLHRNTPTREAYLQLVKQDMKWK